MLVRGFNVMKEYFNDPAATGHAIDAEGWLRTGDVGFLGRRRQPADHRPQEGHVHRAAGFNVYPAEMEGSSCAVPTVAQVAVVGVPDERLGEVGHAFVVPRAGAGEDLDGSSAWCRDHGQLQGPAHRSQVVDALPLNPSGKVMKFRLRDEAAATA